MDKRAVVRILKYGTWSYDQVTKQLSLKIQHPEVKNGELQEIVIPKSYIFSIQRFMTSVFQNMSRHRKK